jgi:hypothetical protein
MPRKFELSWEGHPAYRWVKMYKGDRYRISCADLGIPQARWTKEDSYQAANAWWTKKRAELDHVPTSASQRAVAAVEAQIGRPLDSQADLYAALAKLLTLPELPPGLAEKVLGAERVEQLRQGLDALVNPPTVPTALTIGTQA